MLSVLSKNLLVEYSLEEPRELRLDPRSLAFKNSFLSLRRLDKKVLEEAIRLAGKNAYVERRAAGVYISMNSELNPEGRDVPSPEGKRGSSRYAASTIARMSPTPGDNKAHASG